MAIEIKPKAEIRKNLKKMMFLVFSFIIFSGLLGSYFYINYLSEETSQDIEDKDRLLEKSPSEKKLQEELVIYEAKIKIFEELFSDHKKPLNIFAFLEKVSHPNIWFSDFKFDSLQRTVMVSGQTSSFIDLGQQLIILKGEEEFEGVDLLSLSMGDDGLVNFSLKFIFKPDIFK